VNELGEDVIIKKWWGEVKGREVEKKDLQRKKRKSGGGERGPPSTSAIGGR